MKDVTLFFAFGASAVAFWIIAACGSSAIPAGIDSNGHPCGDAVCGPDELCCNVASANGACTPYCVRSAACPAVSCQAGCSCPSGQVCCDEPSGDGTCAEQCRAGSTCPAVSCALPPPDAGPDAPSMEEGGPGCPSSICGVGICGTSCSPPGLKCPNRGQCAAPSPVEVDCVASSQGGDAGCCEDGLTWEGCCGTPANTGPHQCGHPGIGGYCLARCVNQHACSGASATWQCTYAADSGGTTDSGPTKDSGTDAGPCAIPENCVDAGPCGVCPANEVCCTGGPQYPSPTCAPGCAISRREFKDDIAYVDDAERAALAEEALAIHLARYRYKTEPADARRHLGFLIDDQPDPSPAVDADRTHVDLYGYTSALLAAVQEQSVEIRELRARVQELEKRAGAAP